MNAEFEKLKLIYEITAEHYRSLLTWRRYLLVGFIAIQSMLLFGCYKLYLDTDSFIRSFSPWCGIIIMPCVSLLFYFLENRNKILYQSCQKTAVEIEKEIFPNQLNRMQKNTKGLFFDLDKSFANNSNVPSHTLAIQLLFYTMPIIGILIFNKLCK